MGSEFLTSPFDNLLKPVDDHLIVHNELMSSLILGNKIQIHSSEYGIPDLDTTRIVIIGIPENRNSIDYLGDELNLNEIRKSFYNLYPGNWSTEISLRISKAFRISLSSFEVCFTRPPSPSK